MRTFTSQVGEFVHVDVDLDVVAASVVLGGVLKEYGLSVALRGGIKKREGREGGQGGGRNGRREREPIR